MDWYILGAGSIGGLWASSLALAGHEVTLLLKDRSAAAAFEKSPLRFESAADVVYPRVKALPAGGLERDIEWLLVTTKSYSTLDALAGLGARLSPGCKIVLLQNGVGVQQQVAERYPRSSVIAGVTTDGAYRRERFHIVHAGRGKTLFGAVSAVAGDTALRLTRCFDSTGLDVEWVADIWQPIWHKVAVNCCINALSATRRCRNGELLECGDSMRQIRGLAAEIQQVMLAAGLEFSFPDLFDDVVEVIRNTADNYSSMQQDVALGRRTEIEHINGFICAQGESLGVETPLNRALLDAILSMEAEQAQIRL